MAKRRKRNKTLLIIAGVAAAGATLVWFLLDQQKQQNRRELALLYQRMQQQNLQAPKTQKAQDVANWIAAIASAGMTIYGSLDPLFKPGGPFYNQKPSQEVLQLLAQKGVVIPRWN